MMGSVWWKWVRWASRYDGHCVVEMGQVGQLVQNLNSKAW